VGSVAALGVFGQRLIVRPADDLVIVRFGSHPVAANAPMDPIHNAAFDALAERLRG
jgi:CubicO group peptidase (beta-lactamase class C family)